MNTTFELIILKTFNVSLNYLKQNADVAIHALHMPIL